MIKTPDTEGDNRKKESTLIACPESIEVVR